MESANDYRNIAGIFPISQQLLGLYEIGQGLYEIAVIISQAVAYAFKELMGSKATQDTQWVSLGHIVMTGAEKALFSDDERQNAVSIPEPTPTRNFSSHVIDFDTKDGYACEEPDLELASSFWEKLKEPITKMGIGILFFLPIVGTFYSINQLLSSYNKEFLVKEL